MNRLNYKGNMNMAVAVARVSAVLGASQVQWPFIRCSYDTRHIRIKQLGVLLAGRMLHQVLYLNRLLRNESALVPLLYAEDRRHMALFHSHIRPKFF